MQVLGCGIERSRGAWLGNKPSPYRFECSGFLHRALNDGKPTNDDALRLAMIRLAKQYGRYGYRKVTALLRMEGWKVNHKK
ncbi:IS3 family transposase, partial [Pseudohalocynthiibacter aestuariivivens]|uniref:IS3 family transposase n=1 Tax=Pseudohalocynthiibacter aestuariivivens TaxID=1591409 RepID=UPI003CCE72EA